jgi:hypothetical protein
MNYEPNTTHWLKGDFVLHDMDAKEPKMLMRVIGYTRDGLCKTQYVNTNLRRTIWKSELKYLHEPERFGIRSDWGQSAQEYLMIKQENFARVRLFNQLFAPGTWVYTTSADGGFYAQTRNKAYIDTGCCDWVWLEGRGNWNLKFVQPATDEEILEICWNGKSPID